MLVKRAKMFPVECVVRGYLSGSGWKDYQKTGAVCGIKLPQGLRESDRLPEPIFTPAAKPHRRPRRKHLVREMVNTIGQKPCRRPPRPHLRHLREGRQARGQQGSDPRRHEIRVRPGRTVKSSSPTKSLPPTPPATGQPKPTIPAAPSPPSTSSTSATTSSPSTGTSRPQPRPYPTKS